MQGDGPSRYGTRSCSVRSLCLLAVVLVAVTLLVWMYKEQSHVKRCAELAAWAGNHRDDHLPTETGLDKAINVVINMPQDNNKTGKISAETPEHPKWNYNWDHKAWQKKDDANGVPTRTLVLVRHGKYDLNTGHLTDMGQRQANLTGQRLRDLNMAYDRIIHSSLDRAVETADIIHHSLSHLSKSEDGMISEGGPISPDPTVSYWRLPDRNYFLDGPRLEAAFRKHFYRADKSQVKESIDILVGHGNIFRFFILRALQFPSDGWMRFFLPHASISVVHVNPDGTVTMTKIGDSGHLPPDLVTI